MKTNRRIICAVHVYYMVKGIKDKSAHWYGTFCTRQEAVKHMSENWPKESYEIKEREELEPINEESKSLQAELSESRQEVERLTEELEKSQESEQAMLQANAIVELAAQRDLTRELAGLLSKAEKILFRVDFAGEPVNESDFYKEVVAALSRYDESVKTKE